MRRERITITLRSDIIKKIDTVIDGKSVRNRSNAIETILVKEFRHQFLHQAVIWGAHRLIDINGRKYPEIIAPIGEKTVIEHNIEILKKFGITDITLVLSHHAKRVREYLVSKDLGIDIKFIEDTNGKGSAVWQAKKNISNTFLGMNGDIILDTIDIEDMYNFHKKNSGLATVAVATSTNPEELGSIFMKGYFITKFKDKPKNKEDQSLLINGGVYIFEPKIFSYMSENDLGLEDGLFPKLSQERKLLGYSIGEDWFHLHTEDDYKAYIKQS